jgi:replicative DNA helicase
MFRFPKREEDLDKYEDDLIETAMKLMPGHIRIVHCTRPTIDELVIRLERLKAEGYDFDMVIDDYPDLIKPTKHFSDKRFELSEIYTDLRALGDKYGVPIWGASQANRAALSKEVITIQDIAEDIGKAAIADVIIALCQTRDEHDMEVCRLYMAKVRDGESQAMFDAKFYADSQAIITTGVSISKNKEEAEDV